MEKFEYWVAISYFSPNGMQRVESGLMVVEKEIKSKDDIQILEDYGKVITGENIRILSFILLESED